MALNEYKTGTAFSGVMGQTGEESESAWPEPNRAEDGAPNVLFVVLDDTGFAQLGAYGSPISTPNMDRLAANGLTSTNMHTAALRSSTRSCVLTGRNHHSNALACITEGSLGYPGADGNIPFENGFLGEMLLDHGYNTYAVGKWHLTPADQTSPAGPNDRWPLGRGFERYYGFLGGDTHQYHPELVFDNHTVEPPKAPEEGDHLTEGLADKAISFISHTKQAAGLRHRGRRSRVRSRRARASGATRLRAAERLHGHDQHRHDRRVRRTDRGQRRHDASIDGPSMTDLR